MEIESGRRLFLIESASYEVLIAQPAAELVEAKAVLKNLQSVFAQRSILVIYGDANLGALDSPRADLANG